jgi:hypothetical protein
MQRRATLEGSFAGTAGEAGEEGLFGEDAVEEGGAAVLGTACG